MASYRHLARIAVMQTIFEYEFLQNCDISDLNPSSMLAYNIRQLSKKIEDKTFPEALLKCVLEKKDKIAKIIQEYAPQWPMDKIAPVDRAILEIGVCEIAFSSDIPPVVAINEAIEIAKVYGDTNSPKFINGVLSTVMTNHTNKKKS
ncbi:transcription antitermination factor NusB [Patescibacteria group bacterium]